MKDFGCVRPLFLGCFGVGFLLASCAGLGSFVVGRSGFGHPVLDAFIGIGGLFLGGVMIFLLIKY